MKIQVTQEDINNGIPYTCRYCPIANAIKRVTGREVFVSNWEFNFTNNFDKSYQLPRKVRNKIIKWECHNRMEPFEFEINID